MIEPGLNIYLERMRQGRIIISVFALLLVFGTSGCKQMNARKSAEVNDAVIFQHKQLMTSLEKFIDDLDSRDAAQIEVSRENLLKASTSGQIAIENLIAPDCNSGFLPAAKKVFAFYGEVANGDYARIARYYSMDSISYSQYDSLQVLVKEVETTQRTADQDFLDAQQTFARDCGFKLVRNVE